VARRTPILRTEMRRPLRILSRQCRGLLQAFVGKPA
jgi:hypothetical protein